MQFKVLVGLILILGSTQSCNSGEFSGDSSKRQAAARVKPKPNPNPNPITSATPTDPGDPVQPVPPGLTFDSGKMCISKNAKIDVNVFFVADVTGSMSGTIGTVANNMGAIAGSIGGIRQALGENRIKDIRLGFIPYIDQLSDQGQKLVPLSTDIGSVSRSIVENAKVNGDHSDSAEGGLWAFSYALQLAKEATAANQKAINIVFIATDAWSHDGGPCGPDCHANGQRRFDLNGVTAQLQDPAISGLLVYDWSYTGKFSNGSGDFVDGTVNRYGSPRAQWEAVRNIFRTAKGAGAGAGGITLGNPDIPNSQDMVNTVVSHLNANIVGCP